MNERSGARQQSERTSEWPSAYFPILGFSEPLCSGSSSSSSSSNSSSSSSSNGNPNNAGNKLGAPLLSPTAKLKRMAEQLKDKFR